MLSLGSVARTSRFEIFFVRFLDSSGMLIWLNILVVAGSIFAKVVSLRAFLSRCCAPSVRGVLVSLKSIGGLVLCVWGCCILCCAAVRSCSLGDVSKKWSMSSGLCARWHRLWCRFLECRRNSLSSEQIMRMFLT